MRLAGETPWGPSAGSHWEVWQGSAADTCGGWSCTGHPCAPGCLRNRKRRARWNQREKSFPPAMFFQHPLLSIMAAGREEMIQGPAPGSPSKAMKGSLKFNGRKLVTAHFLFLLCQCKSNCSFRNYNPLNRNYFCANLILC